jgi:hypothetical protein
VQRAAEGDVEAFMELVNKYHPLILAMTGEYNLTASETGHVLGTTYGDLAGYIDRPKHPERVGAWLIATAQNECLQMVAAR